MENNSTVFHGLRSTERLALEYLTENGEWHVNCGWMCNSYQHTRKAFRFLTALGYAEYVPLAAPIWKRPDICFRYRPTQAGREAWEKLRSA